MVAGPSLNVQAWASSAASSPLFVSPSSMIPCSAVSPAVVWPSSGRSSSLASGSRSGGPVVTSSYSIGSSSTPVGQRARLSCKRQPERSTPTLSAAPNSRPTALSSPSLLAASTATCRCSPSSLSRISAVPAMATSPRSDLMTRTALAGGAPAVAGMAGVMTSSMPAASSKSATSSARL